MRILYFTDVFPPNCGGSGWSVYFFAKALRDRGHEVDIVSLSGNSGRYDGLEISAYATTPANTPFFSNRKRYKEELPEIARSISSKFGRYDVIHAHHKLSAIAVAMAIPMVQPVQPFLVTLRDYWPICPCGRSQFRTGDTCSVYDFSKCSEAEDTWKG